MKKIFALILAVALFAVSAASADETQGYAAGFSALILAVEDGTLLVEDVESQTQYEVHLSDQSQIISDGPLYEGNFVTIQYDGKATRSDPAQITAGCVTRFTVSGPVAEISEQDNTLLVDDKLGSQVLVRLPDVFKAGDYEGCYVVVCFSGAMTMSLPGQVNALTVDSFYAKYGVVTSLEDGQMMIDSEGTPWQVNFDEKTRGQNMAQIGDTVRVSLSPSGGIVFTRTG